MNEPILVGGKKFVTILTAEFQNADIDLTLLFEGLDTHLDMFGVQRLKTHSAEGRI